MFAAGSYDVVGRFAIATGNLAAADVTGRVKSLAMRVVAADGQEWRSGMNNSPVFPVATPRAFYELTRAQEITPATGKPDPEALSRFYASHPETKPFTTWAKSAPWSASWADQAYNSLNAFQLVDAVGAIRTVRWSLQPTLPPTNLSHDDLARLGPNFLERDLRERLDHGTLRWTLVLTLAAPGDPSNDATRAWPADREKVDVGTLEISRAQAEAVGPCRDVNYDPTILPTGMRVSDDPLLAARSSAYAKSFDLRTAEAALPSRQAGGELTP